MSVFTPIQNYSESSDDLVFEIGDPEDDIETKKKHAPDDRVGYGVETEAEEDVETEDVDPFEDFEEFEFSDEGDEFE